MKKAVGMEVNRGYSERIFFFSFLRWMDDLDWMEVGLVDKGASLFALNKVQNLHYWVW